MKKRRTFIDLMMEQTALGPESVPNQSIVEIFSNHRVLIENHQGVSAYGQEKILVNVKYGLICICGCNLELMHMTKEQLVICGRIDSVVLQRRK